MKNTPDTLKIKNDEILMSEIAGIATVDSTLDRDGKPISNKNGDLKVFLRGGFEITWCFPNPSAGVKALQKAQSQWKAWRDARRLDNRIKAMSLMGTTVRRRTLK